jgi:type IV secretion system protein VirD4
MNTSFSSFNQNLPLSAEFGSIGLIGSWFNKGFLIGRYKKTTRLSAYENILLSGPTGSGKTSRFLLKNLYSLKNCSLLINDPQGELWHYASGYLGSHFKNVYSINFSDSSKSAAYNPFSRIKKASDVYRLADLLISTTLDKGGGDVFWKLASVNLTQVLLRILLHQPKEYHNLANLIRLLQLFAVDHQKVDGWVAQAADEKLMIDYKEIISMPEKTLMNVVSSVKSALQLFDDPEIARTTAYDTIDFEQLRREPTAIFLNNTLSDQRYISILNSLFFEQFYSYALEKLPARNDLPIFVILEECASLYIPMLAQATATCRKAKVGNFLTVQSHSQLKSFYKDRAETIKANCRTKIWLTGQTSLEELREIETLGGKRIYRDEKNVERTVPLVAADSIRMLPEDRSLILSGNHPLILAKSSPYYHSLWFAPLAKIPPLPFENYIPDEPIPLLR